MRTPRPNRDADLSYLLGRFDAGRMIRLEAVPRPVARLFRNSFTNLQHRYPSADRNITYLSWSLRPDGDEPYAAINGGWSFHRLHSLTPTTGAIMISGKRVNPLAYREWLTDRREVSQLPLLYSRPVRTMAHEHGHTMYHELLMSDQLLDTETAAELLEIVREVIPSYTQAAHVRQAKAWNAGVNPQDLPIIAAFMRQDLGQHMAGYKHEPLSEVIADAFSLYVNSSQAPLVRKIGNVFESNFGRGSRSRQQREEAIFAAFKNKVPSAFDLDKSELHPSQIRAAHRDRDPRFALTSLNIYKEDKALLGLGQIQTLPSLVNNGLSTTSEAYEVATWLATEPATTSRRSLWLGLG